jgi:tRNA nucleotidyltransferase (CCA-adding enzyme)
MMARRAQVYPQVDPTAAGLVTGLVAGVPAGASASRALGAARARDAAVLTLGDAYVLREDLARAVALGLDDLPAAALARPLPVLDARASEIVVRRRWLAGAAFVVVRDGRRIAGAIARRSACDDDDGAGVSLAGRIGSAMSPAALAMLATIGQLAAAHHTRAFLVGGLVRDALRGAGPVAGGDADIVVEGDGLGVARALAARRGGRIVEHGRFLTASIAGEPGDEIRRVDIATARAERYEARGALPRVTPAGILADLRRRDFSVNAMAVELGSGLFGLLDPLGGRADLAARRLRVLHPLSFVEDPTRIFRAARYAVRLGLRHDLWSAAALRLALRLVPYPRLSGSRLTAELDRIVAEPASGAILGRLGNAGAFRLVDARYRFTPRTAARARALGDAIGWSRAHGLAARPLELAVVTLLADQEVGVTAAALRRLAFSGETLARLERAVGAAPDVAAALRGVHAPSARARRLRRLHPLELAWLRVAGDARARTAVEWFVERGGGAAPALRGHDVIALGVPPGPAVARTLERLTDARLDGAVGDVDGERAYVRALVEAAAVGTGGDEEPRSRGGEG